MPEMSAPNVKVDVVVEIDGRALDSRIKEIVAGAD